MSGEQRTSSYRQVVLASLLAVISLIFAGGAAPPARAAFPGSNGKLVVVISGSLWIASSNSPITGNTINRYGHRLGSFADADSPRFSPNGQSLVFERSVKTDKGKSSVWLINVDGSGLRRITPPGEDAGAPSFTPDGRSVVYYRSSMSSKYGYGVGPIVERSLSGGSEHVLIPSDNTQLSDPVISPDGKRIAYTSFLMDESGGLYVADINGTNAHPLSVSGISGGTSAWSTDWSPDGSKLTFVATTNCVACDGYSIYIANADGSGARRISSNSTGEEAGENAWDPTFSPDGKSILYLYAVGGGSGEGNLVEHSLTSGAERFIGTTVSSASWQPLVRSSATASGCRRKCSPHLLVRPSLKEDGSLLRPGVVIRANRGKWRSRLKVVYSYKWWRSSNDGHWSRIKNATSAHYRISAADFPKRLRVSTRAKNAAGSATVTSYPIGVPSSACVYWAGLPGSRTTLMPPSYGDWRLLPTEEEKNISQYSRNGGNQKTVLESLAALIAYQHPYWWHCDDGKGRPGSQNLPAANAQLAKANDVCAAMATLTRGTLGTQWNDNPYCPDIFFEQTGGLDLNRLKAVSSFGHAFYLTLECAAAFGPERFVDFERGVNLAISFPDELSSIAGEVAANHVSDATKKLLKLGGKVTGLGNCVSAIATAGQGYMEMDRSS